ncbi:hypothetical protein [Labrys wisconsinensis]|uniref:Uncharacterized protein n=1 Tax=Labrys wisconsinensis TaxID=425677 RepID=A0ABU0JL57_9HYPH|nr:hypothetical protein [Labrys wisconsinensis]MDQ0475027.1 hypothetical protein [Labrys wisconsinensis]
MSNPHAAAAFARPEAAAIRAVAAGTATPEQQRLAVAAIGQKACLIDEISYVPGGPDAERATVFAEGRRFVGMQIRRAIRLPIEQFPEVDHG